MAESPAIALAAIAAAALLHWAIGRAAHRIPHWLAQRSGRAVGAEPPARRVFAVAGVALRAVVWLGVLTLLGEHFTAVMHGRQMLSSLVSMSFEAPLLVTEGGRAYTGWDLFALPVLLALVWFAATALVALLRWQVLTPIGVESGLQETIAVLARYAAVLLGGVVVLHAWGVDLKTLALLASVLGVGIGFGLQNIANNFVSGVLINFERPVRPGDFVAIGDLTGTVQRVGARSTVIRTLDEVSILVPNARFLEQEVINWSHGSPLSRVHVPVGVAYGSDVARVRHALLEAAADHPSVRRDPRPRVQLRRFGESALDFELLVWTCDPRNQYTLISDLNFRIAESLARHGVAIPFPQRDLHLGAATLAGLARAVRGEAPEEAPKSAVAAHDGFDASDDPASWTDAQVEALARRMRGPDGVAIEERRHLLTRHPRSFVGRDAVEWLMQHEGLTRSEAITAGQRLVAIGAIHHVLREHGFRDGHFFYRFREDERGV